VRLVWVQIVNRVNTINGRTFKNDPTIFGWDIMNE
jgi:mannan endo-1,4-beta-mannosidase